MSDLMISELESLDIPKLDFFVDKLRCLKQKRYQRFLSYIIRNEGATEMDIYIKYRISQTTASTMLTKLASYGFITKEKDGKWKRHYITAHFHEFLNWIETNQFSKKLKRYHYES